MLTQILAAEFFNRGLYDAHLQRICDIHRERRDVMMDCIQTLLPEEIKYVYPDGRLFTWVELPEYVDTAALLAEAIAQKVAYMPGREFFVEGQPIRHNCMRISFGGVRPEKIRVGMDRLANVIRSRLYEIFIETVSQRSAPPRMGKRISCYRARSRSSSTPPAPSAATARS